MRHLCVTACEQPCAPTPRDVTGQLLDIDGGCMASI
jgi:hypothetical protein